MESAVADSASAENEGAKTKAVSVICPEWRWMVHCDHDVLGMPVVDREASRLGQGDAADPQFYEDIDQVTFDASSPGNQAIQCAPQPAGPSGDVLPEPTDVGSLLIKPAGTHHKAPQTFSRRAQPARRVDLVSKEIKAFVHTTDKALFLMQAKTHRCYCLVQAADRCPQMPPGFFQDDDVVHVPNIMNLSADNMAVHGVIQRQR